MRGLINDCLRWLIGRGIASLGLVLEIVQQIKIRRFFSQQKRLRRRYQITAETPVLSFGPELERLIQHDAARAGDSARFALTAGSTAKPKRLLYTKRRVRSVKLAYVDVFARCCRALSIQRPSLYVFSSLNTDDSLTSMLLNEENLPCYLSTLQAPYRAQYHPAIQALASRYGSTAVRLWILAIANPGVLYSTNPSTLSTFLDELAHEWQRSSQLIKDWCKQPEIFDDSVHIIARRLDSRHCTERLMRIAASDAPLPLHLCAPRVTAYICWTGGYVQPFLNRIRTYLPAERYRLIPMYSMSTETIETVSYFREKTVAFLPLASRVLYEFIEDGAADQSENLRTADQLQVGETYTMVVSDPYGLRRYQTDDLFLCKGTVAGLPDLHFVRRHGLAYSFTGEKLTGEQVSTVLHGLRTECAALTADSFLTCVPSQPADESIPHYKIVLIGGCGDAAKIWGDDLAKRCDQLLCEVNCEYNSKRESRRLKGVRFLHTSLDDFLNRIGSPRNRDSWEGQFKFLPICRRTWESFTGFDQDSPTKSSFVTLSLDESD